MNRTAIFVKNFAYAIKVALIITLVLAVIILPAVVAEYYFGGWGVVGWAVSFGITMAALLMTHDDIEEYDKNSKEISK